MIARSVTLRASGPAMSCVDDSGITPLRLDSPCVPRRPTRFWFAAGNANRSAGVAAHARGREARADRRAGAAARSAGHAIQVVRIARLAGERGDRRDARRELVHRRLAENHRARIAQLLDLKRVRRRLQRREAKRAAGGRHVGGVVVVLDQDRDAVQRPAHFLVGALAIQRVGFFARARVDHHDRVQPRPRLVVGLDARQVRLDQPARRDAARRPAPPGDRGSIARGPRRTP